MNKRICVVTGTRAEFGLLRWVMQGISDSPDLSLQIVATGMHLSPEFGLTFKEIESDGFVIDKKIDILFSSDTHQGVSKAIGVGMISFADAFADLCPDVILVLGDRFEAFAASAAALVANIPIAHIHGGESTIGVIDEAFRHSITKMSSIHFVAANEYKQRVIQLGEHPESVYNVGGLGIDNILRLNLLSRSDLENELNFSLGKKSLLVTFHPANEANMTAADQFNELLIALENEKDTQIIFTLPNADAGGRKLSSMVKEFVENNSNSCFFTSLGQLKYLSCIANVNGVIGNSSSGLIEVPSFRKGTINIGDRQKGRLIADSVLNCDPCRKSIKLAIDKLHSVNFQKSLENIKNPYGDGGASKKIVSLINTIDFNSLEKKEFYNIKVD